MPPRSNNERSDSMGFAQNLQLTDISSNQLTLLAWALERHGMDTAKIFSDVGLPIPSANSPVDRVPLVSVIRVLEHIRSISNDPCIGLKLYQHMKLNHLNVLGFALSCSSTLLDLFQRAKRFCGYVSSAFLLEVEEFEDRYLLFGRLNPEVYQQQLKDEPNISLLLEALAFWAMTTLHEVYGGIVPILTIHLQGNPHPNVVTAFSSAADNAPVKAGADFIGVEISKEVMNQPLPGGNPQLARENDHRVMEMMSAIIPTNIVHRCERLIVEGLPTGKSTLKQVANHVGMSERALQQNLQEQGLSFSALVTRIKKTLAIQYLQEGKKNISQIAYLLGFDSGSNFSRAFRSWTGYSPREYKKHH